jgi:hypothetical protein
VLEDDAGEVVPEHGAAALQIGAGGDDGELLALEG